MLTTKEMLSTNPVFILSVNYDNGSIGDMVGEETNSDYLADMTIQYHSDYDKACIAFTIECLVSVNDNKVTIEQMDTCPDVHHAYVNNISDLENGSHWVWGGELEESLHDRLKDMIENQPIYDTPSESIIEAY